MTRMHFQRVAELTGQTIGELNLTDEQAEYMISVFRSGLRSTNGNFDSARFSNECRKQARLNGWVPAENDLDAFQRRAGYPQS